MGRNKIMNKNYYDMDSIDRLFETEPDACILIEQDIPLLCIEDSMLPESQNVCDSSVIWLDNIEVMAFETVGGKLKWQINSIQLYLYLYFS